MTPANRLTPAQRAYLLGYRRAKSRYRAELREMEDRFDDRLCELRDNCERHVLDDRDDELAGLTAALSLNFDRRPVAAACKRRRRRFLDRADRLDKVADVDPRRGTA